jgi:phosphoglycerate dehydrogenase-like enzyme
MHILIIPGVTMPRVEDALLTRIREAAGPDVRITVAKNADEALGAVEDVEVLLGGITPAMFARARELCWVHSITSGADAYLFPEMVRSEVMLTGDKGLVGTHLADHTFALLLSLTRRLARAVQDAPNSWKNRVAYRAEEFELEGCVMGIVGFGGTGRQIARRAKAFGMRCIAVDCDPVPASDEVPQVWGSERLDELLGTADVVTSGLPLTPETRNLFDARAFSLMKPTALFVNVTRGEIMDADALIAAIHKGQIAGAGLDVAPQEPLPPDHPLWTTPNVVMTPHTAGASQFRISRNLDRFCRNIARYRAGEPLEGQINKARGF